MPNDPQPTHPTPAPGANPNPGATPVPNPGANPGAAPGANPNPDPNPGTNPDPDPHRVPAGGIIMWSGSTVPRFWKLCDGTSGTPDLSGRFIVGAVPGHSEYPVGKTGGQAQVQLTAQEIPSHAHSGSTGSGGAHMHHAEGTDAKGLAMRKRHIPGTTTVHMGWGGGWNSDPNEEQWRGLVNTDSTGEHAHSFVTDASGGGHAHENRPPFYALAFIMKE
jgi:microcystin-dependent protein